MIQQEEFETGNIKILISTLPLPLKIYTYGEGTGLSGKEISKSEKEKKKKGIQDRNVCLEVVEMPRSQVSPL